MRRPPLLELPLADFIAPPDLKSNAKRPLSPGNAPLSPHKRRILTVEGLYSPEKRRTPSKRLFADALSSGSASPSRKLDFGLPAASLPSKEAPTRPHTPIAKDATTAPKLAPSPEIGSSGSSSSSSRADELEDYFAPLPTFVARDLPSLSGRLSIHWPGFYIHCDPHDIIHVKRDVLGMSTADTTEDVKENIAPRRQKKLLSGAKSPNRKSIKCGTTHKSAFDDIFGSAQSIQQVSSRTVVHLNDDADEASIDAQL